MNHTPSDDFIASPLGATPMPPAARSPFDDAQAEVAPPCCWRCMSDVSALPVTAKFCRRCGAGLLDGVGRVLPIPRPAAAGVMSPDVPIQAYTEEGRRRIAAWLRLRAALAAFDADELSHRARAALSGRNEFGASRTPIVTGYANALYHLGVRYGSGLAAQRMPGEAIRCFIKSARLGKTEARERLEDLGSGADESAGG